GVGRAQPLAWITRSLPAQVHEAVERDSDLAEVRPEQIPDEAGVEIVAARRDGRMRREHDAGAGDKARFLERHLARRPQLANAHVTRADRSFDLHAVDLADGQIGATVFRVHLELAAARVDVLSPEALPVEQSDRDQRQSQVAGRLQVVTREYSEPAGIDRQAL